MYDSMTWQNDMTDWHDMLTIRLAETLGGEKGEIF
jgi:hypothetical protein